MNRKSVSALTIGFIGLGLIGGSIAKSIRKFFPKYRIIAHSHTPATTEQALTDGLIDQICTERDPAFGSCDMIFLCAPVQTNMTYLPFLKKILKPGCILTDVGSVKNEMHEAVRTAGLAGSFIGGHPMTGSEKTGLANAKDYLLENAYYVITPNPESDQAAVDFYVSLVSALGAIPLVLPPGEHDYIVAGVSHLPHILASCLVNTVASLDNEKEQMKLVAAGGFKDITRIASSSPVMWQQICLSNDTQILKVLDTFIQSMQDARSRIAAKNSDGLMDMFTHSRDYRDSLLDTVSGPVARQYVMYVDIYDEPGGIATITTMLAISGINIRNIGIIHNREFEEGVLRIEFDNEQHHLKALEILKNHNYVVRKY